MGQILSIAQNTALFSLLGTTFGGNGQTTFALPNFSSRVPVGAGQGPGLSSYVLGQTGGNENFTMTINQMPGHTHGFALSVTISAAADTGSASVASAATNSLAGLADPTTGDAIVGYNATAPTIPLNVGGGTVTGQILPAGGNQPFPLLQPYLAINYIIATSGIFPSRN